MSRISVEVSETTKEELDRFTESQGLSRSFVFERALLSFMEAWQDVPKEALLPPRMLLEDAAFDRLARLVDGPPEPVEALRELMSGRER